MKKASNGLLIGSVAGGFLSQGAGTGALGCSQEDNSFYCKSSRLVMNIKNILFIIMCIALIYYLFKNRKQFMG